MNVGENGGMLACGWSQVLRTWLNLEQMAQAGMSCFLNRSGSMDSAVRHSPGTRNPSSRSQGKNRNEQAAKIKLKIVAYFYPLI
jgi:hypothetical protein